MKLFKIACLLIINLVTIANVVAQNPILPQGGTVCSGGIYSYSFSGPGCIQPGAPNNWCATLDYSHPSLVTVTNTNPNSQGQPCGNGNYTAAFSIQFAAVSTPTTITFYVERENTSCDFYPSNYQFTVTLYPKPAAFTINATKSTVCPGEPFTLSVNNPQSGVTYTWSNGAAGSWTGNSISTGIYQTTTYTVTATNSNGCKTTSTKTITATNLPVTITPSVTSVVCGGSVTLTANGATTYSWNTGQTTRSITVNPTSTREYIVTGTTGTCSNQARQTITVTDLPSPTITANPLTVCGGGSSTLSVVPQAGLTYTWSNGHIGSSTVVTPSATTMYYVTATNAAGCTSQNGVKVFVNAGMNPISITPSNPTICQGDFVTLSVVNPQAGVTYTWNSGQTGSSITVNPSSSFTYRVTGSNGICTDLPTASSTVTVLPTIPIPSIGNSQFICQGQSTTITINNPQSGVVYTWSNGQTGTSITVSPTVTTPYTVSAGSGTCAVQATKTINVTPIPEIPTITFTKNNICQGESVTLSVHNPLWGVIYTWNNGQTGTSITVSPSTTTIYTVTANNGGCISSPRSQTIVVTPLSTPSIGATKLTICPGESTTLFVSNPESGVSYTWSNGQTGTSITVSPSTTTTYSLTASKSGCVKQVNQTVTVTTIDVTLSASSTTITAGQNVTLTASGATTYSWNTGQTGTSINVSPSQTTTYTVTGTKNGCTDIATITIVVATTGLPDIACSGETYLYSFSGPGCIQPGAPNDWCGVLRPSHPSLVTITNTNPNSQGQACGNGSYTAAFSIQFANVSVPTTITFYIERENTSCDHYPSDYYITVTVYPSPIFSINSSSPSICAGGSSVLSIASPQAGVTYSWNTIPAQTGTSITVNPSATTTYTATATNAAGCTAQSSTIVIMGISPQVNINASATSVNCGSSVTLTASGATTYSWTKTVGGVTTSAGTGAILTVSPSATTTYTVTGTTNGCSATASQVISTSSSILPPVVNVTAATICQGSSTTLSVASPQVGVTYSWNTTPVQTGTSITVSPSTTRSYTVTATANSCSATTEQIITVAPTPIITATQNSICSGGSSTLTVTNPQTGFTYTWRKATATTTVLHTGTSFTVTPLVATTYIVVASNGTCSMQTSKSVTLFATVLTPTITSTTTNVCSGQAVTLSVSNPEVGVSYSWNTTPVQLGTTITVNPGSTTTYTVTATNADNCSAEASREITVSSSIPTPIITANPTPVCSGQTVTLSVSNPQSGVTYTWDNGQTGLTRIVNPSFTTTYRVTANNSSNCAIQGSLVVTVASINFPTISATQLNVCNGTFTTLSVTPQSGVTYTWNTGQTGSSITVSPTVATTYIVTARNSLGCSNQNSQTITVNCSGVLPCVIPTKTVTLTFPSYQLNEVINSSAQTLSDNWFLSKDIPFKVFGSLDLPEINSRPYVIGKQGIWRGESSFAYVTDRKQSAPINLSEDGTYTLNMFNWKYLGELDCPEWRKVETVSEYHPQSSDVERYNILKLYSSFHIGYSDQLVSAAAANSKQYEFGFEGFEEYTDDIGSANANLLFSTFEDRRVLPIPYWFTLETGRNRRIWAPLELQTLQNQYSSSFTQLHVLGKQIDVNYPGEFRSHTTFDEITIENDKSLIKFSQNETAPFEGFWTGKVGVTINKATAQNFNGGQPKLVDGVAHTGTKSLKIELPASFNQPYLLLIPNKKYVVSAWVRVDNDNKPLSIASYQDLASLQIELGDRNGTIIEFKPEGQIIEGWQRIEGNFTVPSEGMGNWNIHLVNYKGLTTYFDDVRLFPSLGNMESFVYDTETFRLEAKLDANNYATFYYYDAEGRLYLVKQETARGVQTLQTVTTHTKRD